MPYQLRENFPLTNFPHFARDLRAADLAHNHMQTLLLQAPPANSVRRRPIDNNPFSAGYIVDQALSNCGYDIAFVKSNDAQSGESAASKIIEYADPEILDTLRDFTGKISYIDPTSLNAVIYEASGARFTTLESDIDNNAINHRRASFPALSDEQFDTLWPRAHVTSLLAQVFTNNPNQDLMVDLLPTYEKHRENGIRPFGHEELFGMANTVIKAAQQ